MEARLLNAKQRFFRLLFRIAEGTGTTPSRGRLSVRVPLSEADIADMIGMNRSAFSRLKRDLLCKGDLRQCGSIFSFIP
jgi:CRP-like cAMP-binding protein